MLKSQPRSQGFLISFLVLDICYKKGDRRPGYQVARVNEIFKSPPVWMFLNINFQFEITTLCGSEIFQHIFDINSQKYSEKPLLHSDIWSLFWTLIQLWFLLKCICCSYQLPLIKFSKTHARRLSHSLCSRRRIAGNSLQNLFKNQLSWATASYFTDSEHWAWCS